MNSHLCNRCGSCVGLSDGHIIFTDKTGKYKPLIVKQPDDKLAELLWHACSGKHFNFPAYRKKLFPQDNKFHPYTGSYQHLSIAYSTAPEIRRTGASGGIISAICIWLLEKKKIEGVVCLRMSKTEPWMNEAFIAQSKEEVLEAAQSKYTISSVNEILPEIQKFKGRLAYVGLPGQVQSIRKLQAIEHPSVEKIHYIFGPFYGNTLHFSSISSFLRSYGKNDYTRIEKLYFRHGEWPGNMRVELNDGELIELKKFHANYLIPFHILKNSLLCTDLSNEYTDISGGDAWAPVYEERGKGFSILVCRTSKGRKIIDEMKRENLLGMQEITEDDAIQMHSHGYDLKKRGAFIRIRFRKWMGKPIPDYGYNLRPFPVKRYVFEFFLDTMFMILGTRLSRWLVEKIPPKTIGGLFEKVRTLWKKATSSVKRNELIKN